MIAALTASHSAGVGEGQGGVGKHNVEKTSRQCRVGTVKSENALLRLSGSPLALVFCSRSVELLGVSGELQRGGEIVKVGRELSAERCKDDADAAGDGAVRLSVGRLASVGEAAASMVRL